MVKDWSWGVNSTNSKRPRWPQTLERLPGRGGVDQHPDPILLVGEAHYLPTEDKSQHFRTSLGVSIKSPTRVSGVLQRVKMLALQT